MRGRMVGPRVASRIGATIGPIDVAGGFTEPMLRDGPLNVWLPTCPEHLPLLAPDIPVPAYMWLPGRASAAAGSIYDKCNNPPGVLPIRSNVLFNEVVTGWAERGMRVTTEGGNSGAWAPFGALYDIGNQDVFAALYHAVTVSNGARCVAVFGGTNQLQIQCLAAGQLALFVNGTTTATSNIYENATPTVGCTTLSWQHNPGFVRMHTRLERVTGTFVDISDSNKGLGGPIAAPLGYYLVYIVWVGLHATYMINRGGFPGDGGRQFQVDAGWNPTYPAA
jgi:hypothetical protein